MEDKQLGDYFGSFATSIRKLMEEHPEDGRKTSPATLAAVLGTTTQTISYYINGKRKPSYDNIVALVKYFGVSADYLLFGVASENLDFHKRTGLSDDSIKQLEKAYKLTKQLYLMDVTNILNNLLSDGEFYDFMEDVNLHISHIIELEKMDFLEREKEYPGVDIVGYHRWFLYREIDEFILGRLEKHGLSIKS